MTTHEIKVYLALWADIKWPDSSPHEITDKAGMEEILTEGGKELSVQDRDPHRHWDEITVIKQYGDKIIGYGWADGSGDRHPTEVGWEFDWDTVEEYFPFQVIHTVYKTIKAGTERHQYKGYQIVIRLGNNSIFTYTGKLIIDNHLQHSFNGTVGDSHSFDSVLTQIKAEIDEKIK